MAGAGLTPTPYLGSKISLISKSEIRYEGILYTVDTKESTIALAKVKSFGTEDRPTEHPVPARDDVYEYIIFKAVDIKDLMVCEVPKQVSCLVGGLPNDPAIVQISTGQQPPPLPGVNGNNVHVVANSGGTGGQAAINSLAGGGGRKQDSNKDSSAAGESGKNKRSEQQQKSGGRQKRKSQSQADGSHQRDGSSNRNNRARQSNNQRERQQDNNSRENRGNGRNNDRNNDRSGNRRDNSRGDRNDRNNDRRRNDQSDYQMIPFPRGQQIFALPFPPPRGFRPPYGGPGGVGLGGPIGALPFRRGEVAGGRGGGGQRVYDDHHRYGGPMMMPRMGGGGYYPDRRAFNNGPIDGYYNYNSRDGQQRRQGGGNGRFDYELNGRMPRQPYRGSQQRLQQLKFEGDYDFEGANQQFKETLEKLSNVKINESSQENADGGDKENAEGEKKADESAAEEGEIKDEKFYDKTKSFFDAISCESVERSEAKPNDKAQRGVQRQKNQETFGQSAIRSYGYGGGYRRYGNRGGLMRNVPLRYRS